MRHASKRIAWHFLVTGLLLAALLLSAGCGGGTTLGTDQALSKTAMKKPVKPPPEPADNTPPAAVDDLAVAETSFYSLTVTWTATGDDGNDGQADSYDLRYSTSPITADNWDFANTAAYEPDPGPPGSTETFVVYGVLRNTTYYIALKVGDEADNWSELSNVVEATTDDEPCTWDIELVDDSSIISLHDGAVGLAYDPLDGNPSIVYNDRLVNDHKYAHYNGAWVTELMNAEGSANAQLAFDPLAPNSDRNPVMCYGLVRLDRWNEANQQWETERAFDDRRDLFNEEYYMAYAPDADKPSIACVTRTGRNNRALWALQLAQWNGSEWEFEYVTDGAPTGNPYQSTIHDPWLAFDAAGNAYIAYTDTTPEFPSVLKIAWRNAGESSWQTEIVDAQDDPTGNCFVNHVYPSLACNPVTGYPGIACRIYAYEDVYDHPYILHELRYSSWNGTSWNTQVVDDDGEYVGWGATLAYDSAGTPCIGYLEPEQALVRFAKWSGQAWNIEIVDSGRNLIGNVPLVFDSAGNPSIVYQTFSPPNLFFASKP